MKNQKRRRVFAVCLALLLAGVMVFSVIIGVFSQKAMAAEGEGEGYSYYVFIYSGKEGYFSDPSNRVIKQGPFSYGTPYSVDMASLGLVVENTDLYYARGLKIAGHDNDEIGKGIIQSYTFPKGIVEDVSLSVAYGMAGGMVQYTVNYVEAGSGAALYPTETYYGMVGDKPVVSYQYVDGYRPNAYNLGKTLVEDESQNVFTFTYTALEAQTPEEEIVEVTETVVETVPGTTTGTGTTGTGTTGTGTTGTGTAGTGNEGTGTAGTGTTGTGTTETGTTGTGTGTGTGNEGTGTGTEGTGDQSGNPGNPGTQEPQEYIDLDDEQTPLEDIQLDEKDDNVETESVEEKKEEQNGFDIMKILPFILIAAAAVVILLLVLFFRKKRNS